MTLSEANDKKKKLDEEIKALKQKISQWNVVARFPHPQTGMLHAPRPYNMVELTKLLSDKRGERAKLKCEIQTAYGDVQDLVFEKREIEDDLLFLEKELNMTEDFYGQRDKAIDELKRDFLIGDHLNRIDEINVTLTRFERDKVL